MGDGLVSISECARRLAINKSTLSRFVRDHQDLNEAQEGEPPKVNPTHIRKAREERLNLARSGNHAGELLDASTAGDAGPAEASSEARDAPAAEANAPSGQAAGGKITYADAKARNEDARARTNELNFQQRVGTLTPRQEVEDAIYSAGCALSEQAMVLPRELGQELAAISDPNECTRLIEDRISRLLTDFADNAREALRQREDNADAA